MKEIAFFEELLATENVGLDSHLGWAALAYNAAQRYKAPAPVFYDLTPADDLIPQIIEVFKKSGVTEFYYCSGCSGLIDKLAIYQEAGCKIDGVCTIPYWTEYEPERTVNALKITI